MKLIHCGIPLVMVLCWWCQYQVTHAAYIRNAYNDGVHDASKRHLARNDETIDDMINRINKNINRPDVIEGDIIVPLDGANRRRSAVRGKWKTWPNKVVPYEFTSSISVDKREKIKMAITELALKTCVKFRPKQESDGNWISFRNGEGCLSNVGFMPNHVGQRVTIGDGCEVHGIIVHEIMHALGFYHEQSRPDRNGFVKVQWENIIPGKGAYFSIVKDSDTQGLKYDFDSVMHYGKTAFSKNGKPTLVTRKNPSDRQFGQREGASKLDIEGINKLYECENDASIGGDLSQWSSWSACNEKCQSWRQRFCKPEDDCPAANSHGIDQQVKQCHYSQCPVAGQWSSWTDFSKCDSSCSKRRRRFCNNPPPQNGGMLCRGTDINKVPCFNGDCDTSDCNCDYSRGGCTIEKAAPPGTACRCKYHGFWTCSGKITECRNPGTYPCEHADKSEYSCLEGGGDCGGYRYRADDIDMKENIHSGF
ncbi:zinc metalloproteinase nas-36-like [Tubulanus polymorphus]|uniref:zinc metalloproteinase nas-36-like n=1 Tax=Tubulanus polymorphus TaxID=672921 RepID=UPI003DA37D96